MSSSMPSTGSSARPGNKKKTLLFIAAGVVSAMGVLSYIFSQQPVDDTPKEKGVVYYTGVKYNVRTGKWVDANGKTSPRPAGETEPPPPDTSTRMTKE